MTENVIWDKFGPSQTKSGEPPMPPTIEERVTNLERGMDILIVKLDNITENYATKADLKETQLSLTKWFIGTAAALAGLILAASGVIITLIK